MKKIMTVLRIKSCIELRKQFILDYGDKGTTYGCKYS